MFKIQFKVFVDRGNRTKQLNVTFQPAPETLKSGMIKKVMIGAVLADATLTDVRVW